MLGTDLVPPRRLGNNRARGVGLRDDPALLFLTPATTAANASPDFYTASLPRTVKYIVDHTREPIPPDRSTSADLSKPPQGAVKRPLTQYRRKADVESELAPRDCLPTPNDAVRVSALPSVNCAFGSTLGAASLSGSRV